MEKELSFEENIKKLETIVKELETGEVKLDVALRAVAADGAILVEHPLVDLVLAVVGRGVLGGEEREALRRHEARRYRDVSRTAEST